MDWNAVNATAAWWGALVGTALGIIKVHQWWIKDRPRFSIRLYVDNVLSTKTDTYGYPLLEGNVFIEIVNDGRDVVIQKVCVEEYPRRVGALKAEYEWSAFHDMSYGDEAFHLGQGKLWRSPATPNFIDRYNDTKDKSRVFVTIYHAGLKSPYRQKTPLFIELKH